MGTGVYLSLDALVATPTLALQLAPEQRATLLVRCASVLAALAVPTDQPEAPRAVAVGASWLTVPEVAERLNLAVSYVYQLARRGDLPSVRQGKYVRIPATGLHEWMTKLGQLDGSVSTVLSVRCERRRGAEAPKSRRVATG